MFLVLTVCGERDTWRVWCLWALGSVVLLVSSSVVSQVSGKCGAPGLCEVWCSWSLGNVVLVSREYSYSTSSPWCVCDVYGS